MSTRPRPSDNREDRNFLRYAYPLPSGREVRPPAQLHPLVAPQVSHFMQVPLRTSVKLPHSVQASPS